MCTTTPPDKETKKDKQWPKWWQQRNEFKLTLNLKMELKLKVALQRIKRQQQLHPVKEENDYFENQGDQTA